MGQAELFNYVWQLLWEKENSEFEPVKLHLKFKLVLHPVSCEELGKHTHTYTHIYIHTYIHTYIHVIRFIE